MNIRAIYDLPHAGAIITAGKTADLPDNLARMLIARGQALDAAEAPPPSPPSQPGRTTQAPVSATPRAEAAAAPALARPQPASLNVPRPLPVR